MVWYRSVSWWWLALTAKEMKASAAALPEAGTLWGLSPWFLWHGGSLPTKHDLVLQASPWGELNAQLFPQNLQEPGVSGQWDPRASAFLGSTDLPSPCSRVKQSVSAPVPPATGSGFQKREMSLWGMWHTPPGPLMCATSKVSYSRKEKRNNNCSWKYQLLCQSWVSWADGSKAC